MCDRSRRLSLVHVIQNLLAYSVYILHFNDDTGIVHNLIIIVVQLLSTLLLAVNDGIEAELLINGKRIFIAVPPGSELHLPDIALARINRVKHWIWA